MMRRKPLDSESKSELLAVRHKGCRITILSYLLTDGRWVPKAWVNRAPDEKEEGQLAVEEIEQPMATREAADTVARKKAIEWIDAQFPTVSG
jgi:hypothetical protein